MTASYIHTRRKLGLSQLILRILAVLYFIGLAASVAYVWLYTQDRFVTTASFRIARQDASAVASGLAQMVLPGLGDTGSTDSQNAIAFVNSADLLLDLEKEFSLLSHYSSPARDFVFRLEPDASIERRLEYYRERISVFYDKDTGLTVLSVDTFSPELSVKIASSLLEKADNFVNVLNQQVADQQVEFIREELARNARQVDEVSHELLMLQNKHQLIDPEQVITANLEAVQGLRMERLRLEADLASILRDSPESPRIDSLRSRLRSLDEAIGVESAKLSGPEQDRLNQVLAEFRDLTQKLEFATKLRTGTELMLEKNRVEAAARSRFFSVIQHPYLPEEVAIPRRPYATATILILGILGFFIFRALAHSVFDRA